jgi:DHA3 family macrolide efflux protein-like MFS transporter
VRAEKPEIEKVEKDSFMKEFMDGVHTLRLAPGMVVLVILSMVGNFLIQPLNVLSSFYAESIHSSTAFEYAVVSAGMQSGVIIGAIFTSIKKHWHRKMDWFFGVILLLMMGYGMMAFAPYRAFWFIFLALFLIGLSLPIINTIYQTILQTNIPQEKLGRVTSIDATLSTIISPVGALIVGPLAVILTVNGLFLISAILGLLLCFVLYTFTGIRKVDFDKNLKIDMSTPIIE